MHERTSYIFDLTHCSNSPLSSDLMCISRATRASSAARITSIATTTLMSISKMSMNQISHKYRWCGLAHKGKPDNDRSRVERKSVHWIMNVGDKDTYLGCEQFQDTETLDLFPQV